MEVSGRPGWEDSCLLTAAYLITLTRNNPPVYKLQ